jgi:hypothetical protein
MQRASVASGGTETGVMLAYIADTIDYKSVAQRNGRLAATVVYQPFGTLPDRRVRLPERYLEVIGEIYHRAGLRRLPVGSGFRSGSDSDSEPSTRPSVIESTNNVERGLLSLFVRHPGTDTTDQVAELIARHQPEVTHVDVCLDDSFDNAFIESLCESDFFFCAVLPEYAQTDVLRLQSLHDPQPEDFNPDLINAGAQKLCDLMRAERSTLNRA